VTRDRSSYFRRNHRSRSDEKEGNPRVKYDDSEVESVKLAGGSGQRARRMYEVPEQVGVTRRTIGGDCNNAYFVFVE